MGISKAYFKGKGYDFLEKGFWCERIPPLMLCCALVCVFVVISLKKKKKILSAIAGFSKNKKNSHFTL